MKRRLFNLVAGISFVLLLSTIALSVAAVRSGGLRFGGDERAYEGDGYASPRFEVSITRGQLAFRKVSGLRAPAPRPLDLLGASNRYITGKRAGEWRLGFLSGGTEDLIESDRPDVSLRRTHWVKARVWPTLTCLALLPFVWLGLKAFHGGFFAKARSQHQCSVCGYDLRATPDRCPECGTPTGTPTPTKPAEAAA